MSKESEAKTAEQQANAATQTKEQAEQKAEQQANAAKAAAEAKEQAGKDAKIAELTGKLKAFEEAAKATTAKAEPVSQQSAQQRYDGLTYDATVVYECDGPDTKTVDGEAEVVTARLQPSCTKKHWEEMPRWEKGSKKGQPMHLSNAKLIGFIEDGALVKL